MSYTEISHPVQTISDASVQVVESVWPDGHRTFNVYSIAYDGILDSLHDDDKSFYSYPTDEQIAKLVKSAT